jgi:hypothetical protein
MEELQLKGLCYNCDDKYFTGNKCKEHTLFMAISEDVSKEDLETPPMAKLLEPIDFPLPSNQPEVEPLISLNSLTRFSTPQTLNLIGYIKNRKVIILIDSGSTHNFIHLCISQETDCYIHVVNNLEIRLSMVVP